MSDIQDARDVLAVWRGHALVGNWSIIPLPGGASPSYTFDVTDDSAVYAANADDEAAARLIVGTAGNPELLDALDRLLMIAAADIAGYGAKPAGLWNDAEHIAAAIIAADEKMSA